MNPAPHPLQPHPHHQQDEKEEASKREEFKNQILSQVLDQEARGRLNTLMAAKPEKGVAVENLLIQMARSGQLRGKISEQELIGLLQQVNQEEEGRKPSVKFDRRRTQLSDDEEDYDL